MSYSSRVYRQRNPKAQEDSKDKPFFSKQKQDTKGRKGTFFQAKGKLVKPGDHFEKEADSVANQVVNQPAGKAGVQKKDITPVQRLASTPEEEKVSSNDERMERDKEKPFQAKSEEPEKKKEPVQKVDDPNKKKEPLQKMDDAEKKKEPVQKMDDPNKKKEPVQKVDEKKDKERPVQKMDAGKEKEKKPEKS
jgi:hypothetical protein